MKLIFCSHNTHKKEEIQKMLPASIEILSLEDLNYHEEIIEDASTFEGNALKKAQTIFDKFKLPCFADDSGLEVLALNNEPGVFSARYAGEEKDDEKNMQLLLKNLENQSNRRAQFKTVICLLFQNEISYFEGKVSGEILHEKQGANGFGYDPIFKADKQTKSFAEMTLAEKNKLSHRAKALEKMVSYLGELKS